MLDLNAPRGRRSSPVSVAAALVATLVASAAIAPAHEPSPTRSAAMVPITLQTNEAGEAA